MQDVRIGFIGGGNMARALIGGLIDAGSPPNRISVGEPLAEARARLHSDFGVATHADNGVVVEGSDVLILAVKPQELRAVAQAVRPALERRRPLIVSIAAGIRLESLLSWCPGCPVVRAMPNRGALIRAGATAVCAATSVTAAQRVLVEQLLRTSGLVVWVPAESQLDAVTALSGSGPAYFFLLAEQMAAAAVALGLEVATARALAAATLHGAGLLAHADPDLTAQRQAVTSKGGTTEAALAVFDNSGLNAMVSAAMRAAASRSEQLARTNS
jgi:pyrroline-5-carboxylate reductase